MRVRRARAVSTAILLAGVFAAPGCADLTRPPLEPAGPPSTPATPAPVEPPYAGSPLSGRWVMNGAAVGVGGLAVTVSEGNGGAIEGSWRADFSACPCGTEGVVQAVGVPAVEVDGSRRRDGNVTLFFVRAGRAFARSDPFMTYTGRMTSATRMEGTLYVSDGSGYFGNDGSSQDKVVLTR